MAFPQFKRIALRALTDAELMELHTRMLSTLMSMSADERAEYLEPEEPIPAKTVDFADDGHAEERWVKLCSQARESFTESVGPNHRYHGTYYDFFCPECDPNADHPMSHRGWRCSRWKKVWRG
jgi:hypothetical protein